MTLVEVKQKIGRLHALNSRIEEVKSYIEEYRTKAEGLHSPQYDNGGGKVRNHDGFESRVISYVEKTEQARILFIELQCDVLEIEGELFELETDDPRIYKAINKYFNEIHHPPKAKRRKESR